MRLQPIRFIGHKIGPFDHIELNWNAGCRATLIVAENAMGKTTLVIALAACLSFSNHDLFPTTCWPQIAYSDNSWAALQLSFEGETGWVIHMPRIRRKKARDVSFEYPSGIPIPDTHQSGDYGVWSTCLAPIYQFWASRGDVSVLAAAYGTHRDIKHVQVRGFQELEDNPLARILDPFEPIKTSTIYQWIINQYTHYALAMTEGEKEEAEGYLTAIQRVQDLFSTIGYPITFHVRRNPLRLEIEEDGKILSVDQLSDGTRAYLSWALDYLTRASRVHWADPHDSATAPGILIIDEVDAHLHPEWQRRVLPGIRQLLPETHIIATTHSPFVVGSVDDAQVFRIRRDAGGHWIVETDYDDLYGYPADLVLEKIFLPDQFGLYPPEIESKLRRLTDLAREVASGEISDLDRQEYDELLGELAQFSHWLQSLLSLQALRKDKDDSP